MEKRSIFAFLLLIGFFVVWSQFAPKQDTQPTDKQVLTSENTTKSLAPREVERPEVTESVQKLFPTEKSVLKEAKIGNYYITYSPQGGYIHSIAINAPDKILPFENIGFQSANKDVNYNVFVNQNSIVFSKNGTAKEFIVGDDIVEIKNASNSPILLFSFPLERDTSRVISRYDELFYKTNKGIQRVHPTKIKKDILEKVNFAGAKGGYYVFALLKSTYNIKLIKNKENANLYLNNPSQDIQLYLGPHKADRIAPYDLKEIIDYGRLDPIATLIIKILEFFYRFLHNWGLSIILFALVAYILLFPLTLKGQKKMKQTQEIQGKIKPEMKKIQEKYKNNPKKLQKATTECYKKHGVNPLGCAGGCLPQIPNFIILFSFWAIAPRFGGFQNANFLWINDFALPDRLFQLPFQIPFLGHWFNLLPILSATIMFFQTRLTTSAGDPQQVQQQKMMSFVMPIMIFVFTYRFPSVLLLYWTTNNILTFLTQLKIQKENNNTAAT